MLFNSYIFVFIFLPITFSVYFYFNYKRLTEAGKGILVFSSLVFYSWWNISYLPIIITSIIFNYILGNVLSNKSLIQNEYIVRSKKIVFLFGVCANLGLLGYFKYMDFFIENINLFFHLDMGFHNIVLPLAISFFTFQQIAYLVDSYKQETKEYDFLNYAVFVTFFPQLIAGPIVHHQEMMPQFANIRTKVINLRNIFGGICIFSLGLFKKVILADTLSLWVVSGFDSDISLTLLEAWMTSLSYTFQLYFDFSGYTDMALGIALLFNIKLPTNFNSPYRAVSIQDFWRRWHITLSRFLRDYIYIPLGGSKKGELSTYRNVLITFIIGGLWHGAGWTFIFWGGLHGCALVIHRVWKKCGGELWRWLAWVITFFFLNITWVFFRAEAWDDAIRILSCMFFGEFNFNINVLWLFVLLLCFLIVALKNSYELMKIKPNVFIVVFYSAVLFLGLAGVRLIGERSEFLYFNF